MTDQRPSEGTRTIQFRVGRGSDLGDALDARTGHGLSPDLVARRDLERYYHLLRRSRPSFGRAEAMAILDVCNGTLWESWSVPLLWASVADAEGLGQKWEIDQDALVARLRGLSYAEGLAVVDAAERFWGYSSAYTMDGAEVDAALAASGLVREELDARPSDSVE